MRVHTIIACPTMRVLAPLLVLAAATLHSEAKNIICGGKKSSQTVTVEDGDTYSYKTHKGRNYKGNTQCSVDYKMGETCTKMVFACTRFNINNKDKKRCSKGDKVTITVNEKSKAYCKKKKPKVTSDGDLSVVFTSNAKKHSTGASCKVTCIEAASTNTTTAPAQKWSTVPKWADFGLYGPLGFKDLDFKLEFAMDNYDIISLEKCTNDDGNMYEKTEKHFVELTSKMRALRPNTDVKILNYWAVMMPNTIVCYEASKELRQNPDLALKDDLGNLVYSNKWSGDYYYDFRSAEARNLWIKAAIDPVIQTDGGANGVFLDHIGRQTLRGLTKCGEDRSSPCEFSAESEEAFNQGILLAVQALKDQIHELDPENILIGNGLMNYDFNAGKGNPTYDAFVDLVDGFCMEHVLGFEGVNWRAKGPPFINIEALENLIQLKNRLVEKNKFVLARSFPGPVGGNPAFKVDGLSTPQLPANHPYPKPTNNLEVQQAMKDLYAFPLAVYLCAFADEKVLYAYSVWYDVRQSVPCRQDPEECQFPADFDEFLKMNPGPPVEEAKWEGRVCSRRFTNFGISVNLEDENSATWTY